MIIELQRGHLRLKVQDKIVTIQGEVLLSQPGSPDFVAYLNSIKTWDPPNDGEVITAVDRENILEVARKCFKEKKMVIDFE